MICRPVDEALAAMVVTGTVRALRVTFVDESDFVVEGVAVLLDPAEAGSVTGNGLGAGCAEVERLLVAFQRAGAVRHTGRLTGRLGGRVGGRGSGPPVGEEGEPSATGDHEVPWPGSVQGLTQRESEILGLICCGLSNREVAQSLFISVNTVKTYIRGCYSKIGAQSRSQAVIWGLAHHVDPRAR